MSFKARLRPDYGPIVERVIGDDLLELLVLFFPLPYPSQLTDLQPTLVRFPAVGGGVADAFLAAHVCQRLASFNALQDPDNLLFTEAGASH